MCWRLVSWSVCNTVILPSRWSYIVHKCNWGARVAETETPCWRFCQHTNLVRFRADYGFYSNYLVKVRKRSSRRLTKCVAFRTHSPRTRPMSYDDFTLSFFIVSPCFPLHVDGNHNYYRGKRTLSLCGKHTFWGFCRKQLLLVGWWWQIHKTFKLLNSQR